MNEQIEEGVKFWKGALFNYLIFLICRCSNLLKLFLRIYLIIKWFFLLFIAPIIKLLLLFSYKRTIIKYSQNLTISALIKLLVLTWLLLTPARSSPDICIASMIFLLFIAPIESDLCQILKISNLNTYCF